MSAPVKYGKQATLNGLNVQDRVLLLDTWGAPGVDDEKLTNLPGAWVLSLRTLEVVHGTGVGNEVNAALARILFGSGGQMLEAFVNVFPDAILQLPSATCRVELWWDPSLPSSGYALPASVTVAAILQRATAVRSIARRISFLPRTITLGSPELELAIPAFARAVRPWGNNVSNVGYSPLLEWDFNTRADTGKFGATGNGGVVTGLQLATVAMGGGEYEINAGIGGVKGTLQTTPLGGAPVSIGQVWGLDWRIDL